MAARETVGLALVLVYELGPVQEYVKPPLPPISDNVAPSQTGPLLAAETVGKAFIVTLDVIDSHVVTASVKVKVTDPEETIVTIPADVTIATAVLLEIQVPPEVGVSNKLPSVQTEFEDTLTIGKGFTVTVFELLEQLFVDSVKVKVTLPASIKLTTPVAETTVATAELLLIQFPPVFGDKVKEPFKHTSLGVAVIVGNGFTVTETVVAVQVVAASVNVKSTEPSATIVIIPADVIVATEVLLLTQVPPVNGETVNDPFSQTEVLDTVTVGKVSTVTELVVEEQPVVPSKKVNVTDPSVNKETIPAEVTVATEVLLLTQDPPVSGDKVNDPS